MKSLNIKVDVNPITKSELRSMIEAKAKQLNMYLDDEDSNWLKFKSYQDDGLALMFHLDSGHIDLHHYPENLQVPLSFNGFFSLKEVRTQAHIVLSDSAGTRAITPHPVGEGLGE